MTQVALDLLIMTVENAIPFAVVFAIGNLIIDTFMRAAFGGKLWIGKAY